MIKVDAKQIVVYYMINVDKFEMSKQAYDKFSRKLKKLLTNQNSKYYLSEEGLNLNNSMFEEIEDFICLKKQFGRQDLYNELNLPYEVLDAISEYRGFSLEDCQENTL